MALFEAICQNLWLSALNVAVAPLQVPPPTEFRQEGLGHVVLRKLVQCAAQKKASGNVVEMNADDALGMVEGQGRRNGRAPIAALGSEALIAELCHQSGRECRYLEWIHAALPGTVRESIAR